MEDWSKYIFDPKNPKGFKAYNLLKKILKDGNAMLVTDMYYFNELFKKEIWTKDVIDELWDIPDNFEELSSNEKAIVYIENFSINEYLKQIKSKSEFIKSSKLYNLFKKRAEFFRVNKTEEYIFNVDSNFLEFGFYSSTKKSKSKKSSLLDSLENEIRQANRTKRIEIWDYNVLIFYKECEGESFGSFINSINVNEVSLVFLNESILSTLNSKLIQTKNLHPIILKEEEDIHQLLDYIIRDIKNETRPKPTHQPNTYLEEITIKNYFSLEKVEMKNLGDKKEIYLMGENGDGKTILLQALALALRGNKNIGGVTDIVKQNPHEKMSLVAMTNDGKKYAYSENPKTQKEIFEPLLAYGINRFQNDSDKKDEVGFLSLFNKHTYLENPVKWLQHLDYKEIKNDYSEISLGQAKDILTDILERDVTITVTPDKVTFTEKGTILEFDQLSDGYQSVIIWVCDLIARLSVLQPNVSSTHDYSGIVLVDEIGAFLHPKWAYGIVNKLKTWFPQIQFIFTTHNPIIILGASEDAAFYKVYKENGKTKVSEPVEDISDLMLNSLVTSPLFNLPTARPKGFDESNDLSSDDYVYRRIHQMIQEKLQTMPNLVDDDVIRMIEAELEKI
jgi:predicted ATPase